MAKTEINTNKLLEMENKLHRYQKALEFYADSNNYEEGPRPEMLGTFHEWTIPVLSDEGARAREVLKDES